MDEPERDFLKEAMLKVEPINLNDKVDEHDQDVATSSTSRKAAKPKTPDTIRERNQILSTIFNDCEAIEQSQLNIQVFKDPMVESLTYCIKYQVKTIRFCLLTLDLLSI